MLERYPAVHRPTPAAPQPEPLPELELMLHHLEKKQISSPAVPLAIGMAVLKTGSLVIYSKETTCHKLLSFQAEGKCWGQSG